MSKVKLSDEIYPELISPNPEVFFVMLDMPIFCNVLWSDQQSAQNCARGDIKLAFCPETGFINNVAFDPGRLEYSQAYENSLDFSPCFQAYAKSLALRLVERHDLHGKDIIEIGCGKGDFLLSLCELGNNRGIGFDPSYVLRPEHSNLEDRVKFIQDFYSERYTNYESDFIACRHTLEHIQEPPTLLRTLRRAIGDRINTAIFFEVPNALDTFRNMAIWDIIYEHCCYFAPVSLAYAFASCGFRVCEITEEFQGQFLCLEAMPNEEGADLTDWQAEEINQLANDIANFSINFQNKVDIWKDKLEEIANKGQRAVVWGAGSKGVTFLNVLQLQQQIRYVVDINPRKQGMYVAGTGQQIVPPEFLRHYQPDIVIVMNAAYEEEIHQLVQNLGLETQLMCV